MITCICDFMIQVWMIAYVKERYANIVTYDLWKDMDMAYGNVGKYESMELNDCALHTANKALLTVYTRYWYYGYGHGHGVCIAFGQCHLLLFLWTFGLLYWLAFGPPTDGRTTVIFPRGSVLVYAVAAIMKMEMSMISYVWIWTAALC